MGYIVCGTKLTKLNACSCCVCRRYTDCGTVLSWGDGSNYKLGHGDTSDQSTPKRIESFAASGIRIVDIACGEQHSMAVDDQGSLYCWGVGREGQLGIGPGRHKLRMPTRIPQSPFEGRRIIRIASNSCFSLVVTEDGRAYSFGWGASGRLGHGDDKQRLFPCLIQSLDREFIVDVACGWRHTLLLNSRGELFSMGRNSNGQLGHRDYMSRNTPQKIECFGPYPLETVVKIACGERFSMALTASGKVYCWGDGMHGQLGFDSFSIGNATAPLPLEDLGLEAGKIVDIACGLRHSVAVSESGRVYAWGEGTNGQLGHSTGSGQNAVRFPYQVRIPSQGGEESSPIGRVYGGGETTFLISKHAPLVNVDSPNLFVKYRQLFRNTFAITDEYPQACVQQHVDNSNGSIEITGLDATILFQSSAICSAPWCLLIARCTLFRTAHHALADQRQQTGHLKYCRHSWENVNGDITVRVTQETNGNGTVVKSEVDILIANSSQSADQVEKYRRGLAFMFEFIYCGSVNINFAIITTVMELSQIFGIPSLKEQCSSAIFQRSDDVNVADLDLCRFHMTTLRATLAFKQDLVKLMDDGTASDIVLHVVDQSGHRLGMLSAHRTILQLGSDYFRSMLQSCMIESTDHVVTIELDVIESGNIDDDRRLTMRAFVMLMKDIYMSSAHVDEDICIPLLKLADQFGQTRLKQLCEMRIAEFVYDEASAVELLDVAHYFNASQLQRVCEYYLYGHMKPNPTDLNKNDRTWDLKMAEDDDCDGESGTITDCSERLSFAQELSDQGNDNVRSRSSPSSSSSSYDLSSRNPTPVPVGVDTESRTMTRTISSGIRPSRRLRTRLNLQSRMDALKRKKWSHDYWLSLFRFLRKVVVYIGIALLFLPVVLFIVAQGVGQCMSDIWFQRFARRMHHAGESEIRDHSEKDLCRAKRTKRFLVTLRERK